MTGSQILKNVGATQVQETVAQSQVLTGVYLWFHLKRGSEGGIEKAILIHDNLNFPGFQFGISHAFRTKAHFAAYSYDMLRPQGVGALMCLCISLGIEHDLSDTGPVTKIDKDETPVIPTPLNPTHENNLSAGVIGTKGAAVVGTLPVTKRV
jgi:hypothetical protein